MCLSPAYNLLFFILIKHWDAVSMKNSQYNNDTGWMWVLKRILLKLIADRVMNPLFFVCECYLFIQIYISNDEKRWRHRIVSEPSFLSFSFPLSPAFSSSFLLFATFDRLFSSSVRRFHFINIQHNFLSLWKWYFCDSFKALRRSLR